MFPLSKHYSWFYWINSGGSWQNPGMRSLLLRLFLVKVTLFIPQAVCFKHCWHFYLLWFSVFNVCLFNRDLESVNKEELTVCTHAYDVPCLSIIIHIIVCIINKHCNISLSGTLSDSDRLTCQYTGARCERFIVWLPGIKSQSCCRRENLLYHCFFFSCQNESVFIQD